MEEVDGGAGVAVERGVLVIQMLMAGNSAGWRADSVSSWLTKIAWKQIDLTAISNAAIGYVRTD